ncbi:MAG: hypothetical protein EBR09_14515 [Proteobacteria bacterium]|nr:hypothetical protein [Pseudomonadota bacterium]
MKTLGVSIFSATLFYRFRVAPKEETFLLGGEFPLIKTRHISSQSSNRGFYISNVAFEANSALAMNYLLYKVLSVF